MGETSDSGNFVVTARKWRPLKFSDVVGQEHITRTLKNSIKSNRIHHAFLFSGPRGVGKTTTARILARALNCLDPDDAEPCNECKSCLPILNGRSYDIIEIDGASNNSVEDIRKLRENVKYPPVAGKYKMYIIDEVHMLSNSAFNALLKTLEEPPPHLIFVFATTEAHKVPATIISRCQRFDFRRMEIDDIISRLRFIAEKEDIRLDDESLMTIAKKADGSMRDAQSIFDQVVAFCGDDVKYSDMADALHLIDRDFYFRISSGVHNGDFGEMFSVSRDVSAKGYDTGECLAGLLEHFRNLLTIKVTGSTGLIESSEDFLKQYENESNKFGKSDLLRYMNIISRTEQSLRFAPQPAIRFESCLLELASMESTVEISELIKELRGLKEGGQGSSAFFSREENSGRSAGYKPASKPAKVKESKPKQKTEPAPQKPAKVTPAGARIDEDTLRNRWPEFLGKYANGTNGLSMLRSAMVSFHHGEVLIQSGEEFIYEHLKTKRQKILNALAEFFGTAVAVRIVRSDDAPGVEAERMEAAETNGTEAQTKPAEDTYSNEGSSNNQSSPKAENMDGKHPVEKAIVELFDAEEIKADE
jgi:DNA polymerase-3 subunit gamma/tau